MSNAAQRFSRGEEGSSTSVEFLCDGKEGSTSSVASLQTRLMGIKEVVQVEIWRKVKKTAHLSVLERNGREESLHHIRRAESGFL